MLEKIKKLEEKIEANEEEKQLLLLYFGNITKLCMEQIKLEPYLKSERDKELSNFHLQFNVHAFTAYFNKTYFAKYNPKIKPQDEFNKLWQKHVDEVLNPIYKTEQKKIIDKYDKPKDAPNYVS